MTTEDLKEGKTYSIEWVDGDYKTDCVYIRESRGFLIFEDSIGSRIFCRPTSIKTLILLEG